MHGILTRSSPWITNGLDISFTRGKVGIGVTDPAELLEVEDGNATTGIQISNTAADGDPFLAFALSGVKTFTMGVDDGDSDKFKIGTTAIGTDTRLTIDSTGDVGIGTTTPNSKLQVSGSGNVVTVSGGNLRIDNARQIGTSTNFYKPATAETLFATSTLFVFHIPSGTEVMRIDGNVGIGVTSPDRLLHPEVSDAITNAVTYALRLSHISSGTVAAGFGVGAEFELEGEDGTNLVAAAIETIWTDPGTGAEDADLIFSVALAGAVAVEAARLKSNADFNLITGGAFQINDTDVIDATTLGAAVVNSSLTNLGTLTGLTVNAAIITLSQDTDFVISGGINGMSIDGTTFSVDGANNRVGFGTAAPVTALSMGNDALISRDTNAGLTASTTQTQGNGALTADINQVSTVANADDTLTLPAAVAGLKIVIINDGANTLQTFPASGDNLGVGLDLAEELEANERVTYTAYDTTNWTKQASTEIIHAEMHDEDNTDAFVVNDAGADFHSYHTNGLVAGDIADWTFDAGGAGTSHAIDSIADGGGGEIAVTTGTAHGLAIGDIISQTNLSDAAYVGIFVVNTITSSTIYEVTATFTATGTGTMDQAATLKCGTGAAGAYNITWYCSATSATNNETFDFRLQKEASIVTGSKVRRKFGTATDFGSFSGGAIIDVADGDQISLALSNEDSAGDVTLRNFTLIVVRL